MFYIRIFSFRTGLAPNPYDNVRFLVRLWLSLTLSWFAYSSIGAVWRSEPAHLVEPVEVHVIWSFVYRKVYSFTEPPEGTNRFFVLFGSEPVSVK